MPYMLGLHVDGLFQFRRPLTGKFFWCPPTEGDRLNLEAVGIKV